MCGQFDLTETVENNFRLKSMNASEEETRRMITERIQEELWRLRDTAHSLVRRATGRLLVEPPATALTNGKQHAPAPTPTPKECLEKEKEL